MKFKARNSPENHLCVLSRCRFSYGVRSFLRYVRSVSTVSFDYNTEMPGFEHAPKKAHTISACLLAIISCTLAKIRDWYQIIQNSPGGV